MASIKLSSLGVKCFYTTATDKATALEGTFTEIPEIKSIPNLSPAPDTIEVTPLANTEYKTYVKGLKDLGGALEFTANLTEELLKIWNGTSAEDETSVMGKYESLPEGTSMWMCIAHPELTQSVLFTFEPSRIGLPEIAVNSSLDATVAITPTGEPEWVTMPTSVASQMKD